MPTPTRDQSRDREVVRSQSVPMWDSSDPERAPPPLPINPGTTSPVTKSNASPRVQAVAANFTEKSRDNGTAPYTTNPMPPKPASPEKSLIKGNYHKRMQSMQNVDTGSEFLNYLENKSPEKSLRASVLDPGPKLQDRATKKPEDEQSEKERDIPPFLINNRFLSKPILNEPTPPSATMLALQNMQLPGENESSASSSSSTRHKDCASSVTGSHDSHGGIESLSTQIHSLTDIASSLQREMANLSRRSKDNATDLVSLKAATNARDEDIRKSLRELSSNLTTKFMDSESDSKFDFSGFLGSETRPTRIDFQSARSPQKSRSRPRMSSPNPFANIDSDVCGSPGVISDGSAYIALLEKVLREMATKDGEDRIMEAIENINTGETSGSTGDNTVTAMLQELLQLTRENNGSRALIRSKTPASPFEGNEDAERPRSLSLDPEHDLAPDMEILHDMNGPVVEQQQQQQQQPPPPSQELEELPHGNATDEMLDILYRIRNSVAEGGGLTNEVKALVRELRGEVLGMGRDIARKFEGNEVAPTQQPLGQEQVAAIVESSLADLKELMASTVNESRQSSSAFSELRSSMNAPEIYSIVKQALEEMDFSQANAGSRGVGMEKEEILETVRQGWETYKPEIELQNFGLERDEILECLTEGLKTYQQPQHEQAVTYDQVLAAVEAGMQSFGQGPSITKEEIVQTIRETLGSSDEPASRGLGDEKMNSFRDEIMQAITGSAASHSVLSRDSFDSGLGRDEILSAVNDGIKTHFSSSPSPQSAEKSNVTKDDVTNAINEAFAAQQSTVSTNVQPSMSRDDILSAIAQGLENQSSQTREIELNKDDLMEAISSALNEASAARDQGVNEQAVGRVHEVLDNMKDEFKQYSESNVKDNGHVLDAVKDGIDTIRKEIEGYAANAAQASGRNEIMETVKEGFHLLQSDLEKVIVESAFAHAPRGNPDTPELLEAMEKEFEHLRQTITTSIVRDNVSNDKIEILDAINDVTEAQKSHPSKEDFVSLIKDNVQSGPKDSDDLVKTIKDEFAAIRESMGTTVARAEPTSDKEDIISALRQTLESHREQATQSKDVGESSSYYSSQILDAFNEGVGNIRSDITKVLDKPVESSSNELLEALKQGLNSLKVDVEAIRNYQVSAQDAEMSRGMEVAVANDPGSSDRGLGDEGASSSNNNSNGSNPFEALRSMISHLQDKVESIENTPRAPEAAHEDALKKEHIDELVAGLNELKASVGGSVARDVPSAENAARKEDTEAIETLLRNTKAQLDELSFESLENVVKETKDAVADLSNRFESEGPTKSEVGTLESLLKDLWIAFDEFKGKDGTVSKDIGGEDSSERLAKSDLQTVEAMIFEVKTQIDELKLPDMESLPTKSDLEGLSTLFTEKAESGGLSGKVDEAKAVVEALGEELKSKLDGSSEGLSELKQVLEGLASSAENFTTAESLKELTELINREFERVRTDQDSGKIEREERDAAAVVKHDETRAAIIVELGTKLDEKIGEVIAKYEDVDTKFTATEERDNAHLEAITETKALAEDIKLVIGAMGNSVNETCERVSEDTKTFFERVDQSYVRMDAIQCNLQNTQERAMGDFERTAAATDRMENNMNKFNPKLMDNVTEILSVTGKHFDHSQQSVEELKAEVSALPEAIIPAIPQPEKYDDTKVHEKLDDLVKHSQDTQVQDKLDILVEHVSTDQVHEKLDQLMKETSSSNGQMYEKLNELLSHAQNEPIHDKLDTLIGHATNTDQSVTQMMKLDEMHKDIMENSRRMNEMFAAQHALLVADHERKRKEAEEAAVALERRTSEREQVESELKGLREEKESLTKFISKLTSEKEGLAAQNAKMSKDLSGLETALELRTEEMHVMEERADGLEKRILEGVLDHARTVLLSRPKGLGRSNSKRSRGTRARGPSASGTAAAKEARGIINNGIGIAMKKRSSVSQAGPNSQSNGKDRRIFSLSQVTGNRGAGTTGGGERQSSTGSGLANLKRSQSVKSNMSQRKSSWGGRSSMANKENDLFPEEDEQRSGDESDTGTERRTSYGGVDRRVSGASKAQESLADPDERDLSDFEPDGLGDETDIDPETKLVLYKKHHRSQPSGNDSGLGTDIASAAE